MTASKKSPSKVSFGPFTVNLDSGELRNDGHRIRLQAQPFQILEAFLERPNELITREELQRRVWPEGTFVDFDQGLNKAINKLRDALCDTADTPRYIETVPKRGYRFIAPLIIEPGPAQDAAIPEPAPAHENEPAAAPHRRPAFFIRLALYGIACAVLSTILIVVLKQRPAESDDLHSIAVLPLLTQSNKTDYDVADGTTDSIINDLSLVPNLRVISHASVFLYRDQVVEPRAVGQKLGVGAVLTGRLEESGTSLTVNLELTATADGRHLWGQQYTRNASDRAGLALEVADAVSDALRLNLTPSQRHNIGTQDASNAEAHQLYLKGRYYFFKETTDDVLRARRLFQEAIDRDPNFALAYSALGDTYDWMATEGYQPLSEVEPQAAAAKMKANELNSSSAEIHTSLAALELVRGNWAKSEAEFQRALQINPNYFEAHRLYSIYLRTMRRFPEAIQHAKLCNELNPLLMPAKSHLALTYYYARQYEAAAAEYRLLLKDDPERPGAHLGLSAVLLKMGKEKEAIEEWRSALTLSGNDAVAKELGQTYAQSGFRAAQEARLRGELRALTRIAEDNYVSPMEFAYRFAVLHDKDAAFRWLDKAYQERSPQLFNLNVDPDYDNLRSDARYQDLLSGLHLPQ
jgi:DNA-binding winged helix-turn-helix (wHTH) protein/TolB-like protein/Flp pilus assembly protein TadD